MKYKEQVESIVNGIHILTKKSYEVEGQAKYVRNQTPFSKYSGDLKDFGSNQVNDSNTERQNLIQHLINTIYSKYYCGISGDVSKHKTPSKSEQQRFMYSLSEANTTKGGYDVNWKIYSVDASSGNAFVQKGAELRWLQPKTYTYYNPQQKKHEVNTFVNIHKPRDSRTIQTVFYHVLVTRYFHRKLNMQDCIGTSNLKVRRN